MNRNLRARFAITLLCFFCLILLNGCGFPGIVSTSSTLPEVRHTQEQAPLPPIQFPRDEGLHNNLTEWWYYTGHLQATDEQGKQHLYGFELVIFQAVRSNLPPLYPAHFAISDITGNSFHYDQRYEFHYQAEPTTTGFKIHVGDWSMQGLNGHDHLAAQMADYALTLDFDTSKQLVLHNGNGLITFGESGFSYYYSRTHMNASGTLIDHQHSYHVTGLAWMDHQWGDFLLLGGGGWDWFSLQLNNNTEMMLYLIRDATGNIVSTYASYIDANGQDTILPQNALTTTVLDHWTSSKTGITYPSGWKLDINDPHLQATLQMQPLLKDQELVTKETTGNIYWEGAVSLQGQMQGQPVEGQGYIELTGYNK